MVNTRVLVDWDGDGFNNKGVPAGTPPNLFPGAPYVGQSKLRALQFVSGADLKEDIFEIFDYGLSYRRVRLGGSSANGQYIRAGYTQPQKWQPLATDPVNVLYGSVGCGFPGVIYSYSGNFYQTHRQSVEEMQEYNASLSNIPVPLTDNVGTHVFVGAPTASQNRTDPLSLGYYYAPTKSGGAHAGAPLFYDSPTNNYLKLDDNASAGAVTWGGFTVSPSTTYTFVFTLRQRTNATNSLHARVYAPSATLTTPNYGRNMLAKLDSPMPSIFAGWATYSITFTTGAADTRVALVLQTTNIIQSQLHLVGGLMLLPGSVATPTRFWDSSITHSPDQMDYVLKANKDYTLSFWARTEAGKIVALTGAIQNYELYTNNAVSEGASSITVSGDEWQRFDIHLPSRTYDRGYIIDWTTITVNGVAISTTLPVGGVDVDFSGFMLVEGTTLWPYHAGSLYEYEDISAYVLSAETKSGRGSGEEVIAYEGTGVFQLNNTDQLFSPEYEEGPLYRALEQNRRILLQIMIDDEWVTVWTGWTYEIDVSPGENRDNRATLSCQQGLFRLRESSFTAPQQLNGKIDSVLKIVVENGGWRAPSSPYQSNLGYNIQLDVNAFVSSPEMIFSHVDEGVTIFELIGQDWGRKTAPEQAIKSLLESENASLWIDREGKLVFVNREYWLNEIEPISLVIDVDAQEADYHYGQGIVNKVEVSLQKKKVTEDESVWKTSRAFKVKPHLLPTDKVEIEIHAEHIEGRQKTITRYTLEGMVKNVYKVDPGLTYANPSTASSEEADKVKVELVPVSGSLYRLRVINMNMFFVWVDIELKGDFLGTGDGITVLMEDSNSIARMESLHTKTISNPILNTEAQARAMGTYYLLRNADAKGEFTTLEIREDPDFFKQVTLGDKVAITEAKTDQAAAIHFVVAENISIVGNTLSVTYTFTRGFLEEFMRVEDTADDHILTASDTGLTVLEYADNFVQDQKNVGTYQYGSVEFVDDSIIYHTSSSENMLILDVGKEQIINYDIGEGLNAGGSAIAADFRMFNSSAYPTNRMVSATNGLGTYYDTYWGLAEAPQIPTIASIPSTKYRFAMWGSGISPFSPNMYYSVGGTILKNWGGIVNSANVTTEALGGGGFHILDFLTNSSTYQGIYCVLRGQYIGAISLVQFSNLRGTVANVASKYHLFASRVKGTTPISYTLTLYNAVTGVVIGSQSQIVGDTPVHFEVNPGGFYKNVFATFGKTTQDWADHSVEILGYGYVANAHTVSSAADLHKSANSYKLYP